MNIPLLYLKIIYRIIRIYTRSFNLLNLTDIAAEDVVNELLNLSLNFIMDADSLKRNEFNQYYKRITEWNTIDKTKFKEKSHGSVFLFDIAEKNATTKSTYTHCICSKQLNIQ